MDGVALAFDDTQYEQEELADLVDFQATDDEVVSRIEHCVSAFLEELSYGRLQSLQTVQDVCRLQRRCAGPGLKLKKILQVSRENSNAYLGSGGEQIRLQQAVQTRSLTSRQGESAYNFVRIFKVLEVVHELVR